jgi:hypothetical protein
VAGPSHTYSSIKSSCGFKSGGGGTVKRGGTEGERNGDRKIEEVYGKEKGRGVKSEGYREAKGRGVGEEMTVGGRVIKGRGRKQRKSKQATGMHRANRVRNI